MAAIVLVALALPAGAVAAKKKKAELVVASLGEAPAFLAAGSTFAIKDKVRNKGKRGKRARKSENGYFLSPDKFRDRSDVELDGSRKLPKLRSRKSSKLSLIHI